jgi:hypothetical protein
VKTGLPSRSCATRRIRDRHHEIPKAARKKYDIVFDHGSFVLHACATAYAIDEELGQLRQSMFCAIRTSYAISPVTLFTERAPTRPLHPLPFHAPKPL